ncbi:hypothetical protein ACFX11_033544 [Malus domestica]
MERSSLSFELQQRSARLLVSERPSQIACFGTSFEAVNVDHVRILQQTVCYDSSKMLPETLLGKPICEPKRKPGFESASEPEAEADAGGKPNWKMLPEGTMPTQHHHRG